MENVMNERFEELFSKLSELKIIQKKYSKIGEKK